MTSSGIPERLDLGSPAWPDEGLRWSDGYETESVRERDHERGLRAPPPSSLKEPDLFLGEESLKW